jgi:hypothetical protein
MRHKGHFLNSLSARDRRETSADADKSLNPAAVCNDYTPKAGQIKGKTRLDNGDCPCPPARWSHAFYRDAQKLLCPMRTVHLLLHPGAEVDLAGQYRRETEWRTERL